MGTHMIPRICSHTGTLSHPTHSHPHKLSLFPQHTQLFIHPTNIYCWLSSVSFKLVVISGAASLFMMCVRIYQLFLFILSNVIRLTLGGRHYIPILQMRQWKLREPKLLTQRYVAYSSKASSYSLTSDSIFSRHAACF